MTIIDPTKLTTRLFKTNFKVSLPVRSLQLAPDQFVEVDFLETLKETRGSLKMSIQIDEELSDVCKRAAADRKKLLRDPKITHDGDTLLVSEENLEWWIEQIEQFTNNLQGSLAIFDPERIKKIREDCEERVHAQISSAYEMRKISDTLTDSEIEQACKNSAQLFIDQYFPDPSEISLGWSVVSDMPTAAVAPIPTGLSPEAQEKLRVKQLQQIKHLWVVFLNQYYSLEERAASGDLHEIEPISYIQDGLLEKIKSSKEALAEKRRKRSEGGELDMGDKKEEPIDFEDLEDIDESLDQKVVEKIAVQFGKRVAQMISRDADQMLKNIKGCDEAFNALIESDEEVAEQYDLVKMNLESFITASKQWLKQYNGGKKIKTRKSENISEIDESSNENAEGYTVAKTVKVTPIVSQVSDEEDDEDDVPASAGKTIKKPIAARRVKPSVVSPVIEDDEELIA